MVNILNFKQVLPKHMEIDNMQQYHSDNSEDQDDGENELFLNFENSHLIYEIPATPLRKTLGNFFF